ncbi:MAG: Uncharacterized protein G01um101425_158 [Candidatus Peregrinibacteria bacterium Gr01-1014_25]|nr:MAG: Uncharacterized protein G01um101425_158 [Candidatus Peregrinibacteria bacterium Gr01-1014_25]
MLRRVDLLLLGIAVGLTLFGLAMIASVSVFDSYQLTSRLAERGLRSEPTNAFYLIRSAVNAAIALGAMGLVMLVPYRLWERLARPLFLLTFILLIAVFLPGIGNNYGTAYSWLVIGGFSIQPTEFLKLTLIFYLAVWLQKKEQLIGTFKEGFLPFVTLLLLSTMLVALQPDLGSFLVLGSIAAAMFFIAGGNLLHLLAGGALAAVMGLPLILSKDYVRDRFQAFLNPTDVAIADTIGFQVKQALIAVGRGGVFGVGYGKSIQKFGYLPEAKADMIFAAMGEELGFLRLIIVLTLYATLVYRGYKIASEAPDRFGFLVAMGISTWIAVQTILNVSVNIALFPLTGLTLPFISYGGSSLLALLIGVGILLNISAQSHSAAAELRRGRSGGFWFPLTGR